MRVALIIVTIGIIVPMFGSCIFAPKKEPNPPSETPAAYLPLTARENLLNNLELAYNERNFERFRELFDSTEDIFLFFFSPNDVKDGLVKNSQWDLGRELAATEAMFAQGGAPGEPIAESIRLELIYVENEDEWQPFTPSSHPNETWYDRSVEYFLEVRVGVTTYSQRAPVLALFTVRQVTVDGNDIWQIVTWRDDLAN